MEMKQPWPSTASNIRAKCSVYVVKVMLDFGSSGSLISRQTLQQYRVHAKYAKAAALAFGVYPVLRVPWSQQALADLIGPSRTSLGVDSERGLATTSPVSATYVARQRRLTPLSTVTVSPFAPSDRTITVNIESSMRRAKVYVHPGMTQFRSKTGEIRLFVDYHEVNKRSSMDAYPPSLIDGSSVSFVRGHIFSKLDFQFGYWQVPVDPKDEGKLSSTAPVGPEHVPWQLVTRGHRRHWKGCDRRRTGRAWLRMWKSTGTQCGVCTQEESGLWQAFSRAAIQDWGPGVVVNWTVRSVKSPVMAEIPDGATHKSGTHQPPLSMQKSSPS
eukprot:Em0005g299a